VIDLIFGLPGENFKSYKKTIGSAIKLSPDFIECFLLTEGGLTKIQCSQPMDGGNLDHIIRLFKEEFTQNGYRIYFSGNFLGFVKKHLAGSSAMNQNTEGVYNQRVFCLALGPSGLSQFPFLKYTISPNLNNYLKQCLTEKRLPDFYGFLLNKDDERRQYIISRIGYYRFIDKKDYFRLFGTSLKGDFPAEINYLIKNRIISESKQSFIWHLNEHEMGHEAFFLHVLKYWYPPRHIRQLIENLNKIRREKVLA
jgi:coproporphyrinogen III oxidase-like Fe-S oxidoreductase